jgi:cell wall-associated NlpC family hydrolase
MKPFDPRLTLARPDLAAQALEGRLEARRYAAPTPMQVVSPVAGVFQAPGGELADQLLFGERFDVLEAADGWAWGQARRDGYVGWVELDRLGEGLTAPTHWVSALATYAFSQASLKTAPVMRLSMNALVSVEAEEGRYRKLVGSGWAVAEHLTPIGISARDPAAEALRFLGAPYLWGGRSSEGLDCSGLVQQALYACGRAGPRDTDMQAAYGRPVEGGLERNDLVFWKGHVGILLDAQTLLHANAFHLATAVEPLAGAVARIEASGGGPPTAFRRFL